MTCIIIGHLEKGETDMDAAIRETEEEAGIKVKDLSIEHDFKKVLTVFQILICNYEKALCKQLVCVLSQIFENRLDT